MRRLIALFFLGASAPALAQHAHVEAGPAPDPHAGHRMPAPAPPQQPARPDAGRHGAHGPQQSAPAQATSPAAADPHAGHDMGSPQTPHPPTAPPPAEALAGPAHAADLLFDPMEMARSRAELAEEHGGLATSKLLVDQLEVRIAEGRESYSWDAQFWYGGDIDKLWLKTDGEGRFGGEFEGVELQALWSHAIGPWFDLQAGLRQDFLTGPDRTHLVLGVQGLAPYWFELDGAVFLSTKGEITGRIEAEYDLRLTQKLILQPKIELDLAAQDIAELGIGAGLSTAETGVRLRYEISRQFAPYVGIAYERSFGRTRDLRRSAGESGGGWSFLLGLRTWF